MTKHDNSDDDEDDDSDKDNQHFVSSSGMSGRLISLFTWTILCNNYSKPKG